MLVRIKGTRKLFFFFAGSKGRLFGAVTEPGETEFGETEPGETEPGETEFGETEL
jgi:hypothetical protein